MKTLLDKGFAGKPRDDLWIAPLAVIGIFLLRGILSFVTDYTMAWLTGRICDLAETYAGGRVVSALEGGYDLDALAASVAAHVDVLRERGA